MQRSTREFHVGDLVSVTTGHMLSYRNAEGVLDLVDFVTGYVHTEAQLSPATEGVTPWLVRQYPWLDDVLPPKFTNETQVWEFVNAMAYEHGTWLVVEAMPKGMYTVKTPVERLAAAFSSGRSLPFVVDFENYDAVDRVLDDLSKNLDTGRSGA